MATTTDHAVQMNIKRLDIPALCPPQLLSLQTAIVQSTLIASDSVAKVACHGHCSKRSAGSERCCIKSSYSQPPKSDADGGKPCIADQEDIHSKEAFDDSTKGFNQELMQQVLSNCSWNRPSGSNNPRVNIVEALTGAKTCIPLAEAVSLFSCSM